MDRYALYLRKSRADEEAEARGEGETLAKHRTALMAMAERRGLNVVREYAELVSGDSITARPQMQALLEDVKQGMYTGVIVNDIDRLGRGDGIDQEIIKITFVEGHCLIITPSRDINPANQYDEDMLDLTMTMARFELRKISQRLTQGRTRSVENGNYIAPRVPYGYKKVTDGKHISLEPEPEAAGIVRMVFNWYASKTFGLMAIATKLNEMGIRSYRGHPFSKAGIRSMLRNKIYTGRMVWGKTATISSFENGKRVKKHKASEPIIVENTHQAIITDELFYRVQEMMDENNHAYPKNTNASLANPLAGLLYCPVCGKAMAIRGGNKGRYQEKIITCITTNCPTKGTYISIIVNAVLEILKDWCARYEHPSAVEEPAEDTTQRQSLEHQLKKLEAQLKKAQEFAELGTYTPAEYIQRRGELRDEIDSVTKQIAEIKPVVPLSAQIHDMLPEINNVLEAYPLAQTIEDKNRLLKTIVARIELFKTESATKSKPPQSLMKLKVYPKLGK